MHSNDVTLWGKKDALIGCIIVTYNRLEKLKKALKCYSEQIQAPKYVIVVNNGSTDGTEKFLNEWKTHAEKFEKYTIYSEVNTGGSGGFYLGEKKALELDADWIMISDDDAYPESDYLQGMQAYIESHLDENLSIVCGKVVEQDSYNNFHRGYLVSKWSRRIQLNVPEDDFKNEYFYPDFTSYVGIVVNKLKMEQVGLVRRDYFIWQDDVEHSYRLSKVGKIVGISKYQMVHDTMMNYNELSWKSYYGWRNFIAFRKTHFKKYFILSLFVSILKAILCPLRGKSKVEVILRMRAIRDGLLGNMGMNEIYKPGWKP